MAEGNAISHLGNLALDPGDDVRAGSYGTWRLTYKVGTAGIARGGRIRVPDRPGMGYDFDMDFLKGNLAEGEPWWG